LEATRKDSAVLLNLSSQSDSSPLQFEISSEDNIGNLIVKVELQKLSYVEDSFPPTKLQTAFGLEAEYLQKTLLDFQKLFRGKDGAASNKSMDVRAKQRLSYDTCAKVSPHVISTVRHLRLKSKWLEK
jgi:hypothetical protein